MGTFEVELNAFCIIIWLEAHGSQGLQCGSLNENVFFRLIFLNVFSIAGRTVWERLRVVALLEKVCHWGRL